jgi:hypothetical protein
VYVRACLLGSHESFISFDSLRLNAQDATIETCKRRKTLFAPTSPEICSGSEKLFATLSVAAKFRVINGFTLVGYWSMFSEKSN